ncbi:3-deoxy-8-phosphooctulonate synthase [bacterium]|nr:3-deoxy-8-phosphooctulonate synthase [bacterium]
MKVESLKQNLQQGGKSNPFWIVGPCVIENLELLKQVAHTLKNISEKHHIPVVFKASFDKANRTSHQSFRGPGMQEGLKQLDWVKREFELPILTDIHESAQARPVAEVADILQIPAFLCRQTDLLEAACSTGKPINLKKGQFLSGPSMAFAAEKIKLAGNEKVLLTERGTTFGYQDLVVDFRNIPWMKEIGTPVVMDVTHSLQQPNQASGVTGGNPQLIGTLAKAAIATGADGLFIETHPDPANAKSDGANMLPLDQLEPLLVQLIKIRKAITI